jgi:transcriptional regulatory protein LevR
MVKLNEKNIGLAELKEIRRFKLENLNSFISYLDTGYSVEDMQKLLKTMYKNCNIDWDNQLLDFCLFVYRKTKS